MNRGGPSTIALLSVLCAALLAAAPRAELIDRILAVVNGSLITLSDVQAALRFGLVSVPAGSGAEEAALEQLVERRLVVGEVERSGLAEPSAERIDAAIEAARARLGSTEAFEAALAETGLSIDALRRHQRDQLRVESYLQQRFGQVMQPSEEQMLAYYRANETEFMRDGVLRPYQDVREDVRAAVAAGRRREMIREWMTGLRRRSDVVVLPAR